MRGGCFFLFDRGRDIGLERLNEAGRILAPCT
jgi:hypothetical protein